MITPENMNPNLMLLAVCLFDIGFVAGSLQVVLAKVGLGFPEFRHVFFDAVLDQLQ